MLHTKLINSYSWHAYGGLLVYNRLQERRCGMDAKVARARLYVLPLMRTASEKPTATATTSEAFPHTHILEGSLGNLAAHGNLKLTY